MVWHRHQFTACFCFLFFCDEIAEAVGLVVIGVRQVGQVDSGEVVDLRHVFDHLPRSVFLDVVHTNEEGARLVAAAVLDAIIGDLERVARPD